MYYLKSNRIGFYPAFYSNFTFHSKQIVLVIFDWWIFKSNKMWSEKLNKMPVHKDEKHILRHK